jgi:hypothetical protein
VLRSYLSKEAGTGDLLAVGFLPCSGPPYPGGVILRKWHRETIYDLVVAAGFDPIAFAFDDDGGESRIKIRHLLAGSYFTISGDAGGYTARYVAGDGPVEDREGLSWLRLQQRVEAWLREVKADLEMPDRWAELRQAREIFAAVPGEVIDNTPFSSEERAEIERQLREFRERARDRWSLSGERLATLDETIDYLVDAADRLGRFDWRSVFAGAFTGLFLSAVFPPESVHHVLVLLAQGVRLLLGN